MFIKKSFVNLLRIFLILFLFLSANAQIQTLGEFKEVDISFNLKLEDSVVEKGKYDFEFLRHGKDVFYLRIRKEGDIICIIPGGEKVKYKNQGNLALMSNDPDIPEKQRLKITRTPALKIASIIFETGKETMVCPFYKIVFKVEYEE